MVFLISFAHFQLFSTRQKGTTKLGVLAKLYAKIVAFVIDWISLAADKEFESSTYSGLRGLDANVAFKSATNSLADAQS
jgi:uncharacterized protein Veg